MRPSVCEDGTNVAVGTEYIMEFGRRVRPWYNPAKGKAPSDWKEKWKKLRDRFEKIIDDGCKMECFLIQRRIPQSKAGHQEYPGVLQRLQVFRACNGLWIEPSRLFAPSGELLTGLFPFNNVRGEPMLNNQNQPVAFRLGLFHHFFVCHEMGLESESTFQTRSRLIELAKDATNLIYQLPSEIACSLWRNVLSGFSKTENADDSLWFDALFQLSLQQQPGSPLHTRRYDWQDNGYIGLVGNGLFPRLPDFDFSTSLDVPKVPKDEDYPMAYYAKLPDLAKASIAVIDEILQRENIFRRTSTKRFSVGLSFSGEHREFIERLARALAEKLGKNHVLYDKYHEAEFARPNLDVYLPNLYRTECDLITVFLCTDYAKKRWCKLEWRFIRQLIETTEAGRIMFFNFDNTADLIELGIVEGDGYVFIGKRRPEEMALLILQRLEHVLEQEETTWQKHDDDKHQKEIATKEEEIRNLSSKLDEVTEVVQGSNLVCEFCGAPLLQRSFGTASGHDTDGREVDYEVEYTEYECGHALQDGKQISPCKCVAHPSEAKK